MKRLLKGITATGLLIFTGCFYGSTFRTPVPVPPDEYSLGLGFSMFPEWGFFPLPELSLRSGLLRNADVGLNVTGYPVRAGTLSGDVKLRLIEEPVSVAAVLGGTMWRLENTELVDECWPEFQPQGTVDTYFYPYGMLLAGNDHYYFGARTNASFLDGESNTATAIFAGLSLGGQDRVLPEVAYVFWGDDRPAVSIGLGFQWNFKHPAQP
jgi:hypothetical protein